MMVSVRNEFEGLAANYGTPAMKVTPIGPEFFSLSLRAPALRTPRPTGSKASKVSLRLRPDDRRRRLRNALKADGPAAGGGAAAACRLGDWPPPGAPRGAPRAGPRWSAPVPMAGQCAGSGGTSPSPQPDDMSGDAAGRPASPIPVRTGENSRQRSSPPQNAAGDQLARDRRGCSALAAEAAGHHKPRAKLARSAA